MKEINCDDAMMAMMAEIDGEETEFSFELINFHLENCEGCRREFEQMQVVDDLLRRQERLEQPANLWAAIETRIGASVAAPPPRIGWQPFALLGAILVGYKLLEMLPRQDFGLAFKIVPLIFIVALFVFLKENPFKINAELALGRNDL